MREQVSCGFVLGAGLGTRLGPLTASLPKPLLPIFGKPLVTFAFDHLIAAGVDNFVVNTHHCPEQWPAHFPDAAYRGCPITFVHEPELLETGGGIRNARAYLEGKTFFVHNGDVLADLDLHKLLDAHRSGQHEVTLALRSSGGPLRARFDEETGLMSDLRDVLGSTNGCPCVFTGIALLSPAIFDFLPEEGAYSVIPVFLEMMRRGVRVGGVLLDAGLWRDIGTAEAYRSIHTEIAAGLRISYAQESGWMATEGTPASSSRKKESRLSALIPNNVLKVVGAHWNGDPPCGLSIEPIEKGGSDRTFFRIRGGQDASLILIHYSRQREENCHYAGIGRFLAGAGVGVPRMFWHDPAAGWLLMEDLGETDLWQFRKAPWGTRRPLYESALDQALLIHSRATNRLKDGSDADSTPHLQPEFDESLYHWEQEYFFQHCLGNFFQLSARDLRELRTLPDLANTARRLAGLPRTLVHRDFQSQNVILFRGGAWLIDFQGLRLGLPHYDLASLLYDPYVSMDPAEREALAAYYFSQAMNVGLEISKPDFEETFHLCAMQRLMQALGAFGFLGLEKGKTRFLDFIPIAGRSLSRTLDHLGLLAPLSRQLDTLCHPPSS